MVCRGRYAAFSHPSHCEGALCEDGKRRTIRLNLQADTAFSWPGRANIKGKTVRGFVTSKDGDYHFIQYKGTK
jgi:hypothetical protein